MNNKKQTPKYLQINQLYQTLSSFLSGLVLLGLLIAMQSCGGSITEIGNENHEFSLDAYSFSGKYLDISNETDNARATFWKPDGRIVFITGRYSNNVAAYHLAEPWQIQTATFLHDVVVPGEFQHGLYFREDGLMMWVFDRTSIWEFNLENPWDITTRSEGKNHDLSHFVQRGHDIDFKPDGSIMFIDDRNAGAVFEYSLATPWDVASGTLTYTLDISDQQIEVRGIEFLKEGSIMMLMDTERRAVLQYNLTEPYNLSTAMHSGAFDVSNETFQGRGLSFSANESIMYVTGRDEEKVFQYDVKKIVLRHTSFFAFKSVNRFK